MVDDAPPRDVYSTYSVWHGKSLKHRYRMCHAISRVENDASCSTRCISARQIRRVRMVGVQEVRLRLTGIARLVRICRERGR